MFFHGDDFVEFVAHCLFAAGDDIGVEFGGADGEVCGVEGERIVHFAESDAVCHHNVRRGMSTREEVFYFHARVDIPLRYAAVFHDFDVVLTEPLALTDFFHRLEGKERLDTAVYQVHHDVVAAGDGIGNGAGTVRD